MIKIPSSEITPEQIYLNRRQFMKMGALAAGALALAACSVSPLDKVAQSTQTIDSGNSDTPVTSGEKDELGDPVNSFKDITNFNNYYEFSTDKEDVAYVSKDFKTSPWTVEVGGLVNKPKTFGIEDILSQFSREERIYRLRCVEACLW